MTFEKNLNIVESTLINQRPQAPTPNKFALIFPLWYTTSHDVTMKICRLLLLHYYHGHVVQIVLSVGTLKLVSSNPMTWHFYASSDPHALIIID